MKQQYLAVFEHRAGAAIGIQFPDFPEFFSAGDTPEDALAMALDCLKGAVEFYADNGRPLPEPSDLDAANRIIAELVAAGSVPSLHWVPVDVPAEAAV